MSRRFIKVLLLSVAMGALTGVVHAYDGWAYEGWYVRGDLGYSFDGEYDIDDDLGLGSLSLDEDWMASGGGGYAFANGFRVEGELAWRDNDLSTESVFAEGSVSSLALMVNGYYDFNKAGQFQPYIGAGIGIAGIEADGANNLFPTTSFDGDGTSLAWQGMLGLAFAATPQLLVDIGYRYFQANAVDTDVIVPLDVLVETDADYNHQAVTFGIRYNLSPPPLPPAPPPVQPPPPPPPAPAACPQSDFTIYFEWDRYDLNQEAQETLAAAFQRARQCNITQVQLVGHTDTSGPEDYNLGLSERRMNVVRDALTSGGLPASIIQGEWRGETDLAVDTPDGVREPLNRRTAVTIRFR